MQLKVSQLKSLLDKKLTVSQMGLIFIIMLVKESDPKMTLAKFKTKVKMKDVKEDLVLLHEQNILSWSGYSAAVKSIEKEKVTPEITNIIEFMNNLYNRRFDPSSGNTVTSLSNRLLKYSVDDVKKVISNRYLVWKDDKVMKHHLNPTVIFRAKNFEKYFDEAKDSKIGESIMTAERISLQDNQILNTELVRDFNDKSIYSIRTYNLNQHGSRIGAGRNSRVYGLALKKLIKKEHNKVHRGEAAEFEYVYKTQ
jgi:uncharacterized phage protein (TIGR02220 family)